MDKYKSEKNIIPHPIEAVYDKLAHPEGFKSHIDANLEHLPGEAAEALKGVSFDSGGITLNSPMGPLRLGVEDSEPPHKVVYKAQQSPVPFCLTVHLQGTPEGLTESVAELEIELPFMLKAMVGSKLKDGVDQLGKMLANLPFG